jgi:phage-related minor tail protein
MVTKLDELVDKYKKELEMVKPKYHNEFIEFMETANASQEFQDYIENDKQAQKAAEIVFDKQIKELNRKARKLGSSGKRKMDKIEKIAAWSLGAIMTATLGVVGAIGYFAHYGGQENSFFFEQRYCLSLKNDAANAAELHQDKTMQLLLEKGEWCSGQSYDDMNVVERDLELFKIYLKIKK